MVKTRVQKWGNSLAIRIPKAFAEEAKLAQDAIVELKLEGGKVVVLRVASEPTLEELVAQITPENRHEETDWGPPAGREVW